MKYLITLLFMTYFIALSDSKKAAPISYMVDVERFWTIVPLNSHFISTNLSQENQQVELQKNITKDAPWLLDVDIIIKEENEIIWSGRELNICKSYPPRTWRKVMILLFTATIFPNGDSEYHGNCPFLARKYSISRSPTIKNVIDMRRGHYEVSMSVKAKDSGEIIFNPLILWVEISDKPLSLKS